MSDVSIDLAKYISRNISSNLAGTRIKLLGTPAFKAFDTVVHYDAKNKITIAGTKVVSWRGRTNNVELTQDTDGSRPTRSTNSSQYFDNFEVDFATSKYMLTNDPGLMTDLSGNFTIAYVGRSIADGTTKVFASFADQSGTGQYEYFGFSPTENLRYAQNGSSTFRFYDGTTSNLTSSHYGTISIDRSSNNSIMRINGYHEGASSNMDRNVGATRFSLGSRPNTTPDAFGNNKLRDFVIIRGVVTDTKQIDLDEVLHQRVGFAPITSNFIQHGAKYHWNAKYKTASTGSSRCSAWRDIIGSADIVQLNSVRCPELVRTGSNYADKYKIIWEASNQNHMVGTNSDVLTTLSGAHTVGVVCSQNPGAAGADIVFSSGRSQVDTDFVTYGFQARIPRIIVNGDAGQETFTATTQVITPKYITYQYNPNDNGVQIRVNGVTEFSGSATTTPDPANQYSMGCIARNSLDQFFAGDLHDVVIVDSWITGSDLTDFETELATKI